MSILHSGARVGAATFVVGISLAWPQAAGIASADKPDQDSPSVSAGPATSGTSSARAHRSNASRQSDNAPATAATRGRTAAAAATSARSTAAARPAPTANQSRRVIAGRATESAIADAVLAAIGNTPPDPASTAGTTTASATVATVAVTTTPKVAASTTSAAAPSTTSKLGSLTVPRANDVVSVITDFFSGLVGSVQSLIEGAGLLVSRLLFNQAPTVLPVQTSGQTTGQTWSTITGTVNAVDPEDDTITYSVVQPDHGTVTIDSHGNYTYVPKTGPDGFTGADTFNVTATDTGLHINLLNLGRAPSTQTIVSVTQTTGAPRVGYTFVFGKGARYWSSEARAALETAANDLSSYFIVSNAVIITYSVTGQRTLIGSTLASAGSDLVSTLPGFYDTVVQQKILTGVDAERFGSGRRDRLEFRLFVGAGQLGRQQSVRLQVDGHARVAAQLRIPVRRRQRRQQHGHELDHLRQLRRDLERHGRRSTTRRMPGTRPTTPT